MQLVHRAEAAHIHEDARAGLMKRLARALDDAGLGEFNMEFDEHGGLNIMVNETRSTDPPDPEAVERIVLSIVPKG